MGANERVPPVEPTEPRRRRVGSQESRLTEANKQLGIVLQRVDIDAEPELAEAVTDALVAVDRALQLAGERDEERQERSEESGGSADTERRAVSTEERSRRAPVGPSRRELVREAQAE